MYFDDFTVKVRATKQQTQLGRVLNFSVVNQLLIKGLR